MAHRSVRIVGARSVGVLVVAAGAWMLLNLAVYRSAEAWSLGQVVGGTIAGRTARAGGSDTLFVGLGTHHAVGLRIDQLCSTGGIVGLVLILTGLLVLLAGVPVVRALLAAGALAGLVAAVNVLRLVLLAWSATRYGLAGWFEWLHLYGGAAVTTAAIAGGAVVYLRLIRRAPSPGGA